MRISDWSSDVCSSDLPPGAAFVWSMAGMLLGGIGFGFFQPPNNRALLDGAPRHRSGAAGGMQATTRVFGPSFGTAPVGVAFTLSYAHGAMMGVIAGISCALVAMGIHIVRPFFSPLAARSDERGVGQERGRT